MSVFHDKPCNISVIAEGISNAARINIATALDSFARTNAFKLMSAKPNLLHIAPLFNTLLR